MDTTNYDIAVDFMDMTNDGPPWTRLSNVRTGFVPVADHYAIVGCEDAEPAASLSRTEPS